MFKHHFNMIFQFLDSSTPLPKSGNILSFNFFEITSKKKQTNMLTGTPKRFSANYSFTIINLNLK